MTASQQHRLEVGEDPKFQEISWKFQRVGFVCLLLFILAGLLGIFGNGGILSSAVARSGDLTVAYDRFVRFASPAELEAIATHTAGGPFTLELGRAFVDAIRFDQILPPPEGVRIEADACIYSFAAAPAQSRLGVRIFYTPKRAGRIEGTVRAGGSEVSFTQFASP